MKRNVVQVAKIRIKDAQVGDVVHRDGKERKGWFKVVTREVLFNGDLQLSDISTHVTISGGHFDLIGVQFVQEVEVPDQDALEFAERRQPTQVHEAPHSAPGPHEAPAGPQAADQHRPADEAAQQNLPG